MNYTIVKKESIYMLQSHKHGRPFQRKFKIACLGTTFNSNIISQIMMPLENNGPFCSHSPQAFLLSLQAIYVKGE